MSYIYVVKRLNNIIGVYNSYEEMELYVYSLLQNNLVNDITVYKYVSNSGYNINILLFNNKNEIYKEIKNEIYNKNKINKEYKNELSLEEKDRLDKINKDKIILQHDINMLNIQKKRIEESKIVYDNDIKLYNLFKNKIENDANFIIPELFEDKYIIFKKLDLLSNLSWETFTSEYNTENDYNDYFIENDYEKKSNIEEEIIIDSE
jgi:hypothetical protein